jgi:signal transduction histidine kinase
LPRPRAARRCWKHRSPSQRRFVGDASHELRTPLAIVRTSVEVLMAKPQTTIAQWEGMVQCVSAVQVLSC